MVRVRGSLFLLFHSGIAHLVCFCWGFRMEAMEIKALEMGGWGVGGGVLLNVIKYAVTFSCGGAVLCWGLSPTAVPIRWRLRPEDMK